MKNTYYILKKLLEHFNYVINDNDVKKRLLSDPNQGILPLTNTLDYFKVKNLTAKVNKESFNDLPNCFIAQVNRNDKYNLVLTEKISKDSIKATVDMQNSVLLEQNEFLNHWTGLGIFIEKNENTSFFKTFKASLIKLGICVSVLTLILSYGFKSDSLYYTIYLGLSIIGLVISILVIKEKMDVSVEPSKFCSFNKDTDCKVVVNSEKSKIFKYLDISDTSIIYFAFLVLSILYDQTSLIYLILSILSLPFIGYAFYQQSFVIKKWCPLCLVISLVLLAQFLLNIFNSEMFLFFDFSRIPSSISVFTLLLFGWFSLKEILYKSKEINSLEIENLTFRRNHNLFLPYYNSLEKIDTSGIKSIIVTEASVNSKVEILTIINPLCETCKSHYQVLKSISKEYPNIKLSFIFLTPFFDKNNLTTIISKKLLQLFSEQGFNAFMLAIDDWFQNPDISLWTNKWGKCSNEIYNDHLSQYFNWSKDIGIQSTPITLINRRKFPVSYDIKDIKNFIQPILKEEDDRVKKESKIFMHECDIKV